MDALRTARHFPIVYINAHPLVGVRHYAEAFEKVHRLLQVVFEVGTLHRFYKAQIELLPSAIRVKFRFPKSW